MSQNQSFFWQTTRHNVYLKRSAKWLTLLALMVMLTFSTICAAELELNVKDDTGVEAAILANDVDPTLDKKDDLNAIQHKPTEENIQLKAKGNFLDAFTASISVILLTELGDKTFFIAAIMAMRHPRLIVFGGAIAALALMTVLSCVFGMAANFIPKIYTYYISTALFLIFGLKMLYDGYKMKPTDAQEELEEVQTDLRKREDALLRKASRKYDDADAKRKNSNSDKEDASEQALIHGGAGVRIVASSNSNGNPNSSSDMQHRQRKQRSNNNNNNNSNSNHNNNNNSTSSTTTTTKQQSCDKTVSDDDYHTQDDSEVFLKDGARVVEQLKMSTFNSSPAHSASIASNRTEQTICESPRNKLNTNAADKNTMTMTVNDGTGNAGGGVTIANGLAPLAGHDSMQSLNDSCASLTLATATESGNAAGLANGINKARLDRDVNAALVNDPESGNRRGAQRRTATYFTMRIFAQAFTMTFLAEWGDRSQLTTIILAAAKDVYGVIVGGILGHCICTGLAVIGGRLVASKISVRTVTIVGGIVFIGFAAYAVAVPPDDI